MAGHTETMVGAPVAPAFSRSVDHVSRFLGLAVSNLYLLAAACTLWEVVARYVFNSPTQWRFRSRHGPVCFLLDAVGRLRDAAQATYRDHCFLPDGIGTGPVVAGSVRNAGRRLCSLYAGIGYPDPGA